ncbi:MAG: response regulator [Lachnospiraceae bacterium]|jgi:two-component system chemotaxis response regulator CheY|nr:response regulator [Lachnospiraceae bacterium]MBQ5559032.1 response regulator [Lachnospiraceae bacterium]MCR4803581.1 response regulator [Lachnospiraceae bacterium]
MKILIAEDDFASRKFMLRFLSKFGECDVTVDGMEAVDAFTMALDADEGYDLVCLDIMMPELDGYQALKQIRDYEKEKGISEEDGAKIIMTTALNEGRNVTKAFELGCVAYAGKPIDQDKFENVLRKLNLID